MVFWRCLSGPRFRASRRATTCLALSASIAIAGCSESPAICVDGVLYSDANGDGIYTTSVSQFNQMKCAEPAQGMSAEGENSRSEVEGEARQPGPKDAPND